MMRCTLYDPWCAVAVSSLIEIYVWSVVFVQSETFGVVS